MSDIKLPSGKTLYALRQACGRGRLRLDVDHIIDKLEAESAGHLKSTKTCQFVSNKLEAKDQSYKTLLACALSDQAKLEKLETAIYELQMVDPHLEFISRVQDAGMHHEWDKFIDALTAAEK